MYEKIHYIFFWTIPSNHIVTRLQKTCHKKTLWCIYDEIEVFPRRDSANCWVRQTWVESYHIKQGIKVRCSVVEWSHRNQEPYLPKMKIYGLPSPTLEVGHTSKAAAWSNLESHDTTHAPKDSLP